MAASVGVGLELLYLGGTDHKHQLPPDTCLSESVYTVLGPERKKAFSAEQGRGFSWVRTEGHIASEMSRSFLP